MPIWTCSRRFFNASLDAEGCKRPYILVRLGF